MRIAVCAIALNEAHHVKEWAAACDDADHLLLADTGSTDDTKEWASMVCDEVVDVRISPFRFDDARNAALAHLRNDIDWVLTVDLDERLQPGWREAVERAVTDHPDATRLTYGYEWADGLTFRGDRWHARHGYRWKYPCHEHVTAIGGETVVATEAQLVHHADSDKPRTHYLPLLKQGYQEYRDDRMTFYYARELMFSGAWQEARLRFDEFLTRFPHAWSAERAYAMRCLASMSWEQDEERWLLRAIAEDPCRESWYAYRKFCEKHSNASGALFARQRQEACTTPSGYLMERDAWQSTAEVGS